MTRGRFAAALVLAISDRYAAFGTDDAHLSTFAVYRVTSQPPGDR
jgi:hypothetical protein